MACFKLMQNQHSEQLNFIGLIKCGRVFFFLNMAVFLPTHTNCERYRQCNRRGLGGSMMWRSLCWAQSLFTPLSPPLSLTCWQLQMGKIWAWSYEQDRWAREESRLVTTAQGHRDGELLGICCSSWMCIYYDKSKSVALARDLAISQ